MTRKVLVVIGILMIPILIQAQDAKELVIQMDKKWRGDYVTQDMTMTIVRPSWQRSISMKSWSRGNEYSMVFVSSGKRKGPGFHEATKRDVELGTLD